MEGEEVAPINSGNIFERDRDIIHCYENKGRLIMVFWMLNNVKVQLNGWRNMYIVKNLRGG